MYIADLHIHSHYSRATSKQCTPEYLDLWARKKGIGLLGTGDFTHPAWRQELADKLIPAEQGLYTLREDIRLADALPERVPAPRFVLSGEISSIYKQDGKVRKVHNVILLPSLDAAETLAHKLEAIGNIHSDGRPILGLSSHDLLEITLESCPEAVFIPAHIWTPHFSLFGAFSGFDSIEACFGDLTPYIHALETGLSSDPPMNWQISALDGYQLISNSDAHSPAKLGREANLFDTELSYPALAAAIKGENPRGLAGTIEFFPEEGKYHYDGHRNCKLCLKPSETEQIGSRCPICGKKITIGVQHRVEQLADREAGFVLPSAKPFESLAPLAEVIAASAGLSAASKKVALRYEAMLSHLGAEFDILRTLPLTDIGVFAGPCVEEGIRRLRAGKVKRTPGYDGEYGKIELLSPSEIEALNGQTSLFAVSGPADAGTSAAKSLTQTARREKNLTAAKTAQMTAAADNAKAASAGVNDLIAGLNAAQKKAVLSDAPCTAVIAGPGTGKTRTLIAKISHLLKDKGVKPAEITAVTFTNQAAGEMKARLAAELGDAKKVRAMTIGTFHAICLALLSKKEEIHLIDEQSARVLAERALTEAGLKLSPVAFLSRISQIKNGVTPDETDETSRFADAASLYAKMLDERKACDFDDLLMKALKLWQCPDNLPAGTTRRFSYLLVDEFQDINEMQYQLLSAWSKGGRQLFVIGDPDQSIYGFRGANAACFTRLQSDRPQTAVVRLVQNYRSTPEIIGSALPVISQNEGGIRFLQAQQPSGTKVRIVTAASELAEGIYLAKQIGRMSGGIDMLGADAYAFGEEGETLRSFSDIAILYRTHRQAAILETCLKKEGIPYTVTGREAYLNDDRVQGILAFFRHLSDFRDTNSLHTCLKKLWQCPEDLAQAFCRLWQDAALSSPTESELTQLLIPYAQTGLLQPWICQAKQYLPQLRRGKPRKILEAFAIQNHLDQAEAVKKLLDAAVFHHQLPAFLTSLLLGEEGDISRTAAKSYAAGTVRLMTLHGAKGLEFPVVFLCGVKKGVIPYESARHPADLAEERRLFYVGMTRAKEELFLLTAANSSPFLADIPGELARREQAGGAYPASQGKQLSLF